MLEHLFDGGMAKIYLAKLIHRDKNQFLVIKIVQPQFSSNESFLKMFEDELKLTNLFTHPGIAQVYDYGKEGTYLYYSMEFVLGSNLKEYQQKLKLQNKVFPIDVLCYIMIQSAKALYYVHQFVDPVSGKPLKVIHRDISPHNIMLTYDGFVKIIDFGIAKSELERNEKTKTGTLKGKISYIGPEYIEGLQLDGRYDLFALGVTFWELATGKKLFEGPNDMAILKNIQECKIPDPRDFRDDLPDEIADIILKCLKKERLKRYQTMDEFQRELSMVMQKYFPSFNSSDVTVFTSSLFSKEIERWKEKYSEYGKINMEEYKKIAKVSESQFEKNILLREKKKKIATIVQDKLFSFQKKEEAPKNFFQLHGLKIALSLFFLILIPIFLKFNKSSLTGVVTEQNFYPGYELEIFTVKGFIKERLPLKEPLRLPTGTYNGVIKNEAGEKKYIQFTIDPNSVLNLNQKHLISEN